MLATSGGMRNRASVTECHPACGGAGARLYGASAQGRTALHGIGTDGFAPLAECSSAW